MLRKNKNGTRILPGTLRINFRHAEKKAFNDRRIFEMWLNGQLSAEEGARAISMNNMVPVTVDQFIANAEWLGFTSIAKSQEMRRGW